MAEVKYIPPASDGFDYAEALAGLRDAMMRSMGMPAPFDKCELLIIEAARQQALDQVQAWENPPAQTIELVSGRVALPPSWTDGEFEAFRHREIDLLQNATPEVLVRRSPLVHAILREWRDRQYRLLNG